MEDRRRYTLSKSERLCGKKNIKELFEKGSSFYFFPFKVYYSFSEKAEVNHSALFSVPKRLVPKAVKRNLIKRRIKEAYRKNKPQFYDVPISRPLIIAYIYTARNLLNYQDIESAMVRCQHLLADKIKNAHHDEEKL